MLYGEASFFQTIKWRGSIGGQCVMIRDARTDTTRNVALFIPLIGDNPHNHVTLTMIATNLCPYDSMHYEIMV